MTSSDKLRQIRALHIQAAAAVERRNWAGRQRRDADDGRDAGRDSFSLPRGRNAPAAINRFGRRFLDDRTCLRGDRPTRSVDVSHRRSLPLY